MGKRPYEVPLRPNLDAQLPPMPGVRGTHFVPKCPSCGLEFVIRVNVDNVTFTIELSSSDHEVDRVKRALSGGGS